MIEFELPLCPSGNHRNVYTRHGAYKSKEYQAYVKVSGLLLGRVKNTLDKEAKLGIKVLVHPKYENRFVDLDNQCKVLFDCIEMHLRILDKRYWHMEVDRGPVLKPNGKMKITIWELHDEKDCATITP